MRFAPTEAGSRRTTMRSVQMAVVRLLIVAYGLASAGLGYVRLRDGDFSRAAWGETLKVWYIEALAFLAVFGGAAFILGVLSRQAREKRGGPITDPLDNTTLAAIERHRTH